MACDVYYGDYKITINSDNKNNDITFKSTDEVFAKDWNFDNVKKELRYFFTEEEITDAYIKVFVEMVKHHLIRLKKDLKRVTTELNNDIMFFYKS